MAFHTEAQRGGLAWSEGDQGGVQITVLALEILGLESRREEIIIFDRQH